MIDKFLYHGRNYFTIQDLMDEVGYEIQMLNEQKTKHMAPVEKEIQLLRMFKSDLRNIVKRYEKLELLIN